MRPGTASAQTLRRYWPPTSKNASVIWPSEQQRTASISTAKTLSPASAACRSRASAAGRSSAWRGLEVAQPVELRPASPSSVARASSSVGRARRRRRGLRKVLTPTIGSDAVVLALLVEHRLVLDPAALVAGLHRAEHAAALGDAVELGEHRLLDEVGQLLDDEAALQRVLVHGQAPLLVDDQLDRQRPAHRLLGRRGDRLVVGVGVQAVGVVVDRAQRLQRGADVVERPSPARAATGPRSGCGT